MLMNDILQPFLDTFVIVYIKNIMIYSCNMKEHEGHLQLVLEALQKNNLYVKMKKCCFGQSEVDFLGHCVMRDDIQTDNRKIQVIREWPLPMSIECLQSFLGLANYYR